MNPRIIVADLPDHIREHLVPGTTHVFRCDYEYVPRLHNAETFPIIIDLKTGRAFHMTDTRFCMQIPCGPLKFIAFKAGVCGVDEHQEAYKSVMEVLCAEFKRVLSCTHYTHPARGDVTGQWFITTDPEKPQGLRLDDVHLEVSGQDTRHAGGLMVEAVMMETFIAQEDR